MMTFCCYGHYSLEGGGDDVALRLLVVALRRAAVELGQLVHEASLLAAHRRERVTARLVRPLPATTAVETITQQSHSVQSTCT